MTQLIGNLSIDRKGLYALFYVGDSVNTIDRFRILGGSPNINSLIHLWLL